MPLRARPLQPALICHAATLDKTCTAEARFSMETSDPSSVSRGADQRSASVARTSLGRRALQQMLLMHSQARPLPSPSSIQPGPSTPIPSQCSDSTIPSPSSHPHTTRPRVQCGERPLTYRRDRNACPGLSTAARGWGSERQHSRLSVLVGLDARLPDPDPVGMPSLIPFSSPNGLLRLGSGSPESGPARPCSAS